MLEVEGLVKLTERGPSSFEQRAHKDSGRSGVEKEEPRILLTWETMESLWHRVKRYNSVPDAYIKLSFLGSTYVSVSSISFIIIWHMLHVVNSVKWWIIGWLTVHDGCAKGEPGNADCEYHCLYHTYIVYLKMSKATSTQILKPKCHGPPPWCAAGSSAVRATQSSY